MSPRYVILVSLLAGASSLPLASAPGETPGTSLAHRGPSSAHTASRAKPKGSALRSRKLSEFAAVRQAS
eukprot:scaffold49022_cov59-Phaeocystis_antarctica.AAC.3